MASIMTRMRRESTKDCPLSSSHIEEAEAAQKKTGRGKGERGTDQGLLSIFESKPGLEPALSILLAIITYTLALSTPGLPNSAAFLS